ncbi:MAG: urea ABC transporter permease subunit UrtC [Brevinematales bacterium]
MNLFKKILNKFPLTFLIFLIILFSFPFYLSDFRLAIAGKFICYSILAIGLDLLWGYTGLLSLGHGVFFGIGAYCMGMYLKLQSESLPDFMSWSGLEKLPFFWMPFVDFSFTFAMIIILPALLAILIGYPVFRSGIKEVYFTILSQALSLIVTILLIGQQPYTGGTNGLTNFQEILGFPINSRITKVFLYYISFLILIVTFIFASWLVKTKTGKILIAIRDGENRLKYLGYNPVGFKLMVYMISAILAGISGALFVTQVGIISPSLVSILPSVEMAMWVAIGGKGTIVGPIFGTFVVNGAKMFLSENFPETWLYFLGVLFIIVVFVFPGGLYSIGNLLKMKSKFFRRK